MEQRIKKLEDEVRELRAQNEFLWKQNSTLTQELEKAQTGENCVYELSQMQLHTDIQERIERLDLEKSTRQTLGTLMEKIVSDKESTTAEMAYKAKITESVLRGKPLSFSGESSEDQASIASASISQSQTMLQSSEIDESDSSDTTEVESKIFKLIQSVEDGEDEDVSWGDVTAMIDALHPTNDD